MRKKRKQRRKKIKDLGHYRREINAMLYYRTSVKNDGYIAITWRNTYKYDKKRGGNEGGDDRKSRGGEGPLNVYNLTVAASHLSVLLGVRTREFPNKARAERKFLFVWCARCMGKYEASFNRGPTRPTVIEIQRCSFRFFSSPKSFVLGERECDSPPRVAEIPLSAKSFPPKILTHTLFLRTYCASPS